MSLAARLAADHGGSSPSIISNSNELFNLSKLREEKGGFHEALGITTGKVRRSSKPKQANASVIDLSDCLVPNIAVIFLFVSLSYPFIIPS